jgi:hypothetical protein
VGEVIDWRSIETAPDVDGQQFLAWHKRGFFVLLAYMASQGMWLDEHGVVTLDDFTHWAPLTPPEGK